MALTDNPRIKNAVRTTRKKPGDSNRNYSDEQKMELMKLYLLTGNLALSAATLKIPEITARWWKKKDWWKQLEAEMRQSERIELSAKLKRIAEKAQEATVDRLENGDWKYDGKTGRLFRVPVSMKDAHKVSMDIVDKTMVLEKNLIESPELEEAKVDKFAELAAKFASLTEKVLEKPPVEVTDIIYVENTDALHEEREAGLQAGERTVQLETGATQEPVRTDSSSSQS